MFKFLNRHSGKIVGAIFAIFFLALFVTKFSLLHYPFLNPRGSVNAHLKEDFGVVLPGSAIVEKSYWVGSRDPEEVYKITMDPQDIGPFLEALGTAAKTKKYVSPEVSKYPNFGPLYGAPPWWNVPPPPDAGRIEFEIGLGRAVIADYRIIYSPSTGVLYLTWGTN